jgi:hypothetical protein
MPPVSLLQGGHSERNSAVMDARAQGGLDDRRRGLAEGTGAVDDSDGAGDGAVE